MNVYQRIIAIRKALSSVRKDKKVEGYMAVTHDNVTAETRDLFIEHGVVITPPSLLSSSVADTGTTTSRGTPFIRYQANYQFWAVNADEPADKFAFNIEAHALDHGDKAPGKALSYAKKYAILKLLELESREEEEAREEQFKPKESKITPNAGAGDNLSAKQKSMVRDTYTMIVDALNEDRDADALGYCESIGDDMLEEKLYLWSLLDSKQRRRIKEQSARAKGKPS